MSNSQTFPNASGFNLAFTNVAATETDSGSVTPFIGQTSSFDLLPVGGGMIEWAGFHTGVIAPGGSETLDFTYDVTSTNPADAITHLGLSMVPDSAVAAGVSLTAVETVYNPTTNAELGQITVNLANPTAPPYTAGDIPLSIGETSLKVDVQVIASVSSTAASSAQATFSEIDQIFGQTPLTSLASIGDNVFLDTAGTGIQSGVNAGPGVAGVTVDLENTSGTVLATTTTNSQGLYDFTNLTPGTYEVQFVTPSGYTLSPQTSIANDLGSAPNQTTGITAPITLTSGENVTNIDAGLVPLSSTGTTTPSGPSISVIKVPSSVVINNCGQVTYTIDVTNTGNTNLYNPQVTDNIGTASQPDDITAKQILSGGYNIGDTNHNGVFNPGETWQYTVTVSYQTSGTGQGGSGDNNQQSGYGSQGANCDTNQQSGYGSQGGQGGNNQQSGYGSQGANGGQNTGGEQQPTNGNTGYADTVTVTASTCPPTSAGSSGCDNQQSGYGNQGGSGDNNQQSGYGSQGGSGDNNQQGGQSGGQGANCDTNQQSGYGSQGGSGDNNNQNPGTTTCVTVTASDTKEIQVLAANSDITVGGTAPTGNLASLYGTAQTLEFTYNPGDTVSLAAGSTALASVTGANSQSMAFLEISNNAHPFASGSQIYFEGSVNAGENIYADAALNPLTNTANAAASSHFSTAPGAETYAFIFGSQADFTAGDAPIQTMTYDTSSAHGMTLGDTIGSLKLAGYIGDHGGHLVA